MKRIILNIGEIAVSRQPALLETILGSCVAVCLWDAASRIGGLNHYLLPAEQPDGPMSTMYGGTSIDTMVGRMVQAGAAIETMQARIYGGGAVISELDQIFNIGQDNVRIARKRLDQHGIPVVAAQVREGHGIRVVFDTRTGEVAVKPLGQGFGVQLPAGEPGVAGGRLQPCKTCIMCGSCQELLEKRRRNRKTGV